jgi:hypothetical protein
MQSSLSPSDIFNKRLAVLKALLGAGWLGPTWTDEPHLPSDRVRVQDWVAMERRYGELVHWLGPGLGHVCRLAVRPALCPGATASASDGIMASEGSVDHTLFDRSLPPQDVPVALMHALRCGLMVNAAGIITSCSVAAGDLLNGIVPFLAWLYCLHDQRMASPERPGRCLVLLAAIPGAGKSVIANMIEQFSLLLKEMPAVQSIGMDGWHLPNRVIQSRKVKDEAGWIVPLSTRKGSPESFDVKRLVADLRSLVSDTPAVRLPAYDRTLHEPVPEAVVVGSPIVLLEGNYLLLQGQGWEAAGDLAAGAAWLDVPLDLARRSILERHVAAGRSRQEADTKWVTNDGPNSLIALRSRSRADVVLHLDRVRWMQFMHRP